VLTYVPTCTVLCKLKKKLDLILRLIVDNLVGGLLSHFPSSLFLPSPTDLENVGGNKKLILIKKKYNRFKMVCIIYSVEN